MEKLGRRIENAYKRGDTSDRLAYTTLWFSV